MRVNKFSFMLGFTAVVGILIGLFMMFGNVFPMTCYGVDPAECAELNDIKQMMVIVPSIIGFAVGFIIGSVDPVLSRIG